MLGVEELIGDVGKNRSAARSDASLGDEGKEAGQKFPEIGTALRRIELRQKFGGKVERITWGWLAGGAREAQCMMTEAKTGVRVQSWETTLAAADCEMGASALHGSPPAPASRGVRGKRFVAVRGVARGRCRGRGKRRWGVGGAGFSDWLSHLFILSVSDWRVYTPVTIKRVCNELIPNELRSSRDAKECASDRKARG